MATEEGTKEIESGVKLAHHIEKNINSLINVINEISSIQENILNTTTAQASYTTSSEKIIEDLLNSVKTIIAKADDNIESMYLLSSLSDSVKSKITN